MAVVRKTAFVEFPKIQKRLGQLHILSLVSGAQTVVPLWLCFSASGAFGTTGSESGLDIFDRPQRRFFPVVGCFVVSDLDAVRQIKRRLPAHSQGSAFNTVTFFVNNVRRIALVCEDGNGCKFFGC